jgi:ABC-2 type transport system permease protein
VTALLPLYALWRREVVRFLRQPNRVAGAIGSPLVFWLLLGSGVGRSFSATEHEGVSYMEYVFPGTVVMILLFTAIFSTISIIEDRKEGFLQSVLVAPVRRAQIVMGKILGGCTLAVIQALAFLALAPVAGIPLTWSTVLPLFVLITLLGIAFTGLGFFIAWRMDSTQGFHAVMNFVLLPMWLLSGALFPIEGASRWMQWAIRANPLTYGLAGIRDLMFAQSTPASLLVPMVVSVAFAAAAVAAATWSARGHTEGDLQ